jgi:hypothetical protein
MDFPNALTQPSRTDWRGAARLSALLALAFYGLFLARNVAAVAAGSDSSGYLNHARLMASGHVHAQARTIKGLTLAQAPAYLYTPLGFLPAPDGASLVPTYPTGFGLFAIAAAPFTGWGHAADLVIIAHSLAGLAATFALGRMLGLPRVWSVLGSAIVAASPLYVFMSLQAMSDVPSLTWTTAAVLAALASRNRRNWALAAGFAVAVDVLLRPTNVLAFIPLAVALGASRRRWILLLCGGLPGAVFYIAHTQATYGTPFTTGYADMPFGFSGGYFVQTLAHYALWLPALFTPVAAFALGLPWVRGGTPSTRLLLGAWILAFGAFYSVYKCTHETWWYLRFLLPAVPALVVSGLLVLRTLVARFLATPARALCALGVALVLIFANSTTLCGHLGVFHIARDELRYGRTADWMRAHLPSNAICLSMQETGALFYYTDFTFIRWDALTKDNVANIEALVRSSGRPLYAVLFPFEIEQANVLGAVMPGHWRQVGTVSDVTLWRRDF